MNTSAAKHGEPREAGVAPLDAREAQEWCKRVQGWELNQAVTEISRTFRFGDYYRTLAFVNSAAWIAHQADHHPILEVGYNYCLVRYSTHSKGGLSENDFLCAARLNELMEPASPDICPPSPPGGG